MITTSIKSGIGVDLMEEKIKEMFYGGQVEVNSDTTITNVRHKDLLVKALENIKGALEDIKMGVPIDCIEIDLRNCWENLGGISGDTIEEDILDKIFSEFCIGK